MSWRACAACSDARHDRCVDRVLEEALVSEPQARITWFGCACTACWPEQEAEERVAFASPC